MAPWYALNLRRGELNVELTADDPVFMADEMARWLSVMGVSVPAVPVATSKREPEVTITNSQPTPVIPLSLAPKPSPLLTPSPMALEKPASLSDKYAEHSHTHEAEAPSLPQEIFLPGETPTFPTEVLEEAMEESTSSQTDTNSLENTSDGEELAEGVSVLPESLEVPMADRGQPEPDDDFERVMSSLMDDLNTQAPAPEPVLAGTSSTPLDEIEETGVFRKEPANLSQQAALPFSAAAYKPDDNPNSYGALCIRAGAATPEDHLLISAYALAATHGVERFSLSELNAVITAEAHDAVTHGVLEVAVSKGLLAAIADLSAEATQYELTRHGRTTVEMFI